MTHGSRQVYQQQRCRCVPCTAANAAYIAQVRQSHKAGRVPLGHTISAQEAARLVSALTRERYTKHHLAPVAGVKRQTLRMTTDQRIRLRTLLKVRRIYRMLILDHPICPMNRSDAAPD